MKVYQYNTQFSIVHQPYPYSQKEILIMNSFVNKYTYVSKETIDGQLRIVYMLMRNKNYKGACNTIHNLIHDIHCAVIYDCEKEILSNIVSESYRSLIDIAFKRYNAVNNRIIDMHYMVKAY